ncbi:hypothetical protein WR25_02270 [Diploscapter pachys]|uniref:Uncharacterized protein n=1 Tax=Diploscapter pachys TaxID=2018661 RepID=A0A2A2JGL3_9BILA|nr:hypothetical protein WR25_02270 [Diploscapter pachys]
MARTLHTDYMIQDLDKRTKAADEERASELWRDRGMERREWVDGEKMTDRARKQGKGGGDKEVGRQREERHCRDNRGRREEIIDSKREKETRGKYDRRRGEGCDIKKGRQKVPEGLDSITAIEILVHSYP